MSGQMHFEPIRVGKFLATELLITVQGFRGEKGKVGLQSNLA